MLCVSHVSCVCVRARAREPGERLGHPGVVKRGADDGPGLCARRVCVRARRMRASRVCSRACARSSVDVQTRLRLYAHLRGRGSGRRDGRPKRRLYILYIFDMHILYFL